MWGAILKPKEIRDKKRKSNNLKMLSSIHSWLGTGSKRRWHTEHTASMAERQKLKAVEMVDIISLWASLLLQADHV